MFKRVPIVFNMGNPHQRELYEWCQEQSTNFSGFARDILLLAKNGSSRAVATVEKVERPAPKPAERANDAAAMGDLL